jgi:hypothetical protein
MCMLTQTGDHEKKRHEKKIFRIIGEVME